MRKQIYNCKYCNNLVKTTNIFCTSCNLKLWNRSCPTCNTEIYYSTVYTLQSAIKNNSNCSVCCLTKHNIELGKLLHEGKRIAPWKGYKHSNQTKNKLREKSKDPKINKMIGSSLPNLMIQKYGNLAEIKISDWKSNIANALSGKNNPMYGKPSPIGSGNGWQGWYKQWRFRSLLELSFVVNIMERFNFKWKSAESIDYRISYIDYDGKDRTYVADFIVEDTWLVEVKPIAFHNSTLVKIKKDAADNFCKSNGLIYKIIDPGTISTEKIIKLYKTGLIKFDIKYTNMFNTKYLKNEKS